MKRDLYSHNQEAYEKVKKAFDEGQKRVAIVHATGSGKSLIIAAVSDHYKKVLVIAPNNFVLSETQKFCGKHVEYRTYASVMCDRKIKSGYNLIVLDEFHRSGAEEWGKGVVRLLKANPDAYIFGTSATHIRYLDNQRNMADEMFDGNIVSHLPLKEAIDRGILPNPTYVSSLYSLDDFKERVTTKVMNCRFKSDDEKQNALRRLKGISRSWEEAHGVPMIIRKYLNKDTKRVIVFCTNIVRASEARSIVGKWFDQAGFKRIRFYNIDYKEKRLDAEMADFQEDIPDDTIKIALSVNMLNEGIHIPRVDSVIMLRSTISRIIIEQQVGRCLTANNKGKIPVILDLVNNMDQVNSFGTYRFDYVPPTSIENLTSEDNSFPFTVQDETRDIRIFFEQITRDYSNRSSWTYEKCKEISQKYTSLKAFRREQNTCYGAIHEHNWVDLLNHMEYKIAHYTKEECAETVKKYDTWKEFRDENIKMYRCIFRNGWEDEMRKLTIVQKTRAFTKEECMEVIASCETYNDLAQKHHSVVTRCERNGWTDLYAHLPRKVRRITKELCKEVALSCQTFAELRKKDQSIYNHIIKNKWKNELCAHMSGIDTPPKTMWTEDKILECAKKCETRKEFYRRFPSAGNASRRLGIKYKIEDLLPLVKRKEWTKEEVLEIASKYSEWRVFVRENRSVRESMRRHGWIEEIQELFSKKA